MIVALRPGRFGLRLCAEQLLGLGSRSMCSDLSPLAPVPAMIFVTPIASFLLNRYWVFRVAAR